MKKRTVLIIAIITVFILLIVSTWFFFLSPKEDGGLTQNRGNVFPSGSTNADRTQQEESNNITGEGGNITDILVDTETPQLRKITANPTASAVIIFKDEEVTIRYVARETGHVFEAFATTTLIERISNTTIPRIQEALFSPDGETLILRYLADDRETIETFLGKIEVAEEETTQGIEGSLTGIFLPQNISAIDINDTGTSLFYIIPTDGGSEGVQSNLEGGEVSRIFTHPLKEWGVRYASNNNIHLTTNPSATVSGFLYSVRKSGSFNKLLSDINGLMAHTNPDNTTVLYSGSSANSITLNTLDLETNKQTTLPLRTLAEKCVWNTQGEKIIYCAVPQNIPLGDYPDIWYQGRISFSDTLWEIDIEAKTATVLVIPEEAAGESIDVIELTLSPDNSLLVFVNKKDSSLWSLTLPTQEDILTEEAE